MITGIIDLLFWSNSVDPIIGSTNSDTNSLLQLILLIQEITCYNKLIPDHFIVHFGWSVKNSGGSIEIISETNSFVISVC